MKKYLTFENLSLFVILTFVLINVGPRTLKHFKLKGKSSPYLGEITDIQNNTLALTPPYALVFWATWCKPCDVELKRINSMVKDKKIKAHQVIAISIDNNLEDVKATVEEKNYLFPVVWDHNQNLSSSYQVQGTPTVVVIGKDNRIAWVTTGISPTLGVRLKKYLN